MQIPLPVLLWSAIGSFTAILYRFNNSGEIELQDPLRWLFTRPLTGVVMGIIAYFAVLIGLIAIGSKDLSSTVGKTEVLWLIAFISGFSDRFADGLLKSLIGHFGGNTEAGLLNFDVPTSSESGSFIGSLQTHLTTSKEWMEKYLQQKRSTTQGSSQRPENKNQPLQESLKSPNGLKKEEFTEAELNAPQTDVDKDITAPQITSN